MNKEITIRKNIPPKIGWELLLPLNAISIYTVYAGVADQKYGAIILGIVLFIFINYTFFGIKYSADQNFLYVSNGIFGTQKINIHHITRIEKTGNPLASPAPSIFGRVEIYWPVGNFIIITPKNYDEFKKTLLSINPNIIVKE